MTTFVLVHGAWHGGWCYKRVARLLRQAGRKSIRRLDRPRRARSPDQPRDRSQHARSGHRRCHPLRGIVGRSAVWPFLRRHGHHRRRRADHGETRSLVYLDAFVPENGKCLFDYLPVRAHRGGCVTMPRRTAKVTRSRHSGGCLRRQRPRRRLGRCECVKQPLATFEQKLEVSGHQVPKRVYMLATAREPTPFQQFGARFKDDRGWQFVSFACGHDVMLDQPQELAAALIAAA